MATNEAFWLRLAEEDMTHIDRAIAALWYFRHTQQYDERSSSDLASDLQDHSFPKPNVTRLEAELTKSKYTVRGRRKGTYQIDIRRLAELDNRLLSIVGAQPPNVDDTVLPADWFVGTRRYLEQMAYQINASCQFGLFDCTATLCRRLMESLIIEVYIHLKRPNDIQTGGVFFGLEKLITTICNDRTINVSRNTQKTMDAVKQIGDTAAHDRTYITQEVDIDDIKIEYRRIISELLSLSGIRK